MEISYPSRGEESKQYAVNPPSSSALIAGGHSLEREREREREREGDR